MPSIILDGVTLQVNTNGIKASQLAIIDDNKPWLARAALASSRYEDDATTFEVVALSGKRHTIAYVQGAPVVPLNNDANLDLIYTKYQQIIYDITGEGLAKAQAQNLYLKYAATQLLWAKRSNCLAKLNDPDISYNQKQTLAGEFNSTMTEIIYNAMILTMYGTSIAVFFTEGNSCQFTDWVISGHSDFQFNLASRLQV